MKYIPIWRRYYFAASHPSRGGWIEICERWVVWFCPTRPTPRGVGGLKYEMTTQEVKSILVPPLAGWVD